jgi:shikimate kinase
MKKPNIILAGFMGTGKTVVGKAVADALGMRYIDTDLMVEAQAKKSIPVIFETEGEQAFRRYETEAIRRVTHLKGYVVSTGGGAPMLEENLTNMKRAGMVVCLLASPEVILDRTSHTDYRPLLRTPDPMKKILALLKIREPQYKKADHVIDTTNLTVDEVAQKVITLWKKQE